MKKLFVLLFCFFVFTGMKVVYDNQTGEIQAIGPFVNYQPKDGQSVLDDPNALPDDIATHIVKAGKYKAKTTQELQADDTKIQQKKDKLENDRTSALSKLKVLGLTDDELKAVNLKSEGG